MAAFAPMPDVPFDDTPSVALLTQEVALVASVRAGDERAFATLFVTYSGSLAAHAERLLGSREEARELVHDVFTNLWIRRDQWTVSTSVSAYLHRSVRNRALNVLRRRGRVVPLDTAGGAADADAMADEHSLVDLLVECQDLATAVSAAIAKLSPRQREVYVLHRRHALTHREIATVLGIAPKTVENLLGRALKSLRTLLGAYLTAVLAATLLR